MDDTWSNLIENFEYNVNHIDMKYDMLNTRLTAVDQITILIIKQAKLNWSMQALKTYIETTSS